MGYGVRVEPLRRHPNEQLLARLLPRHRDRMPRGRHHRLAAVDLPCGSGCRGQPRARAIHSTLTPPFVPPLGCPPHLTARGDTWQLIGLHELDADSGDMRIIQMKKVTTLPSLPPLGAPHDTRGSPLLPITPW